MKKTLAISLLLFLATAAVNAQPAFWRDEQGKPLPETASQQSKDGFAGMVLATADADWKAKWDTPPEVKPHFIPAKTVAYGQKVSILSFFANPALNGAGEIKVGCDIKIIDPTGKTAMTQEGLACGAGKIAGGPYNLRLSAPVIVFSGDPGDPPGTWTVEVTLRDENRKVSLPLKTSFQLK